MGPPRKTEERTEATIMIKTGFSPRKKNGRKNGRENGSSFPGRKTEEKRKGPKVSY